MQALTEGLKTPKVNDLLKRGATRQGLVMFISGFSSIQRVPSPPPLLTGCSKFSRTLLQHDLIGDSDASIDRFRTVSDHHHHRGA